MARRVNPVDNLAVRRAKSTADMAVMAEQSGYPNVAMNLKNLAERRRTEAGLPQPAAQKPTPAKPKPAKQVKKNAV